MCFVFIKSKMPSDENKIFSLKHCWVSSFQTKINKRKINLSESVNRTWRSTFERHATFVKMKPGWVQLNRVVFITCQCPSLGVFALQTRSSRVWVPSCEAQWKAAPGPPGRSPAFCPAWWAVSTGHHAPHSSASDGRGREETLSEETNNVGNNTKHWGVSHRV